MELRAGYQDPPENRRSHLHGQGSGVEPGKKEKAWEHGETSRENLQGGGVHLSAVLLLTQHHKAYAAMALEGRHSQKTE